jgi:hypothetical protein
MLLILKKTKPMLKLLPQKNLNNKLKLLLEKLFPLYKKPKML